MLLPCTETGSRGPLVIALHWLGGSARTWQPLADHLARNGVRTAALNLPGFGDAIDLPGYTVREMAAAVRSTAAALLADHGGGPWLLAGHSMGGKIAAIVAREALDGAPGLENLQGMLLFSPSPPSPEPMSESTREENIAQLGQLTGDPTEDRKRAAKFVTENVGKLTLPPLLQAVATADVLRMNRDAFRAWMERGSREDWSAEVGVLDLPALVFAGETESALGPDAQREKTLPHLPEAELVPVVAAGHLVPLERPAEAGEHVLEFLAQLGLLTATLPELPEAFARLLDSEETSDATEAVLKQRLSPDEPWHRSAWLDASSYRTLRALTETVAPEASFDLAARVDSTLQGGEGDGWRPADLPADAEAFALGLRSLDAASQHQHDGVSFAGLDLARRTALLDSAAQGELDTRSLAGRLHLGSTAAMLDGAAMKLWWEEARGLLTKLYMADPRTYARVGFTGFADDPEGFTQITLEDSAA